MSRSKPIISVEPWGSIWPECRHLVEAHWTEVKHEMPMALNHTALNELSRQNLLLVIVARLDTRIIGYFTWTITPDVESEGVLAGNQGAWFLEEGYPRIAVKMFDRSVAELKALGVTYIWPHHRLFGRGSAIGKFFRSRGAMPMQIMYSLRIG